LTLELFKTFIPKATHLKIPSLMELLSKKYSTAGSLLAASPRKMLSAALVADFWVLVLYGEVFSVKV
jgi:hypothetical protein